MMKSFNKIIFPLLCLALMVIGCGVEDKKESNDQELIELSAQQETNRWTKEEINNWYDALKEIK